MTEEASPRTDAKLTVRYALSHEAWNGFQQFLLDLIAQHQAARICEVGGGANPALRPDHVKASGLDYTVLDISREELDKAPEGFRKVQADIGGTVERDDAFDLIVSKMLAEHIADPVRYHTNVHKLLRPGGIAFHFFPTLYSPPFVINRLLPAAVTSRLLKLVESRDLEGTEGKFLAYYRWCRGPTTRQLGRFEGLGYEVLEYRGFFGARGYYRSLGLAWLDDWISRKLVEHPAPFLTSYAYVVLKRP
ncbi:MAG: class I SAM-dependent methyltransferase [Actinomycetota bacterium]|nr:class I SAM-dependent methyltransferase [Actinomycetota bacterium]